MRAAPFRVVDVDTVGEALGAAAASGGESAFLAGGQDLLGELSTRRRTESVLVSLAGIDGLSGLEEVAGDVTAGDVTAGGLSSALHVGAMTRLHELRARGGVRAEQSTARVLSALAAVSGPRAVQTRATVGGAILSARDGAVWPAALAALDARLVVEEARVPRPETGSARTVADGISVIRRAPAAAILTRVVVPSAPVRLVVGRIVLPTATGPRAAVCAVAVSGGLDGGLDAGLAGSLAGSSTPPRIALSLPGRAPVVGECAGDVLRDAAQEAGGLRAARVAAVLVDRVILRALHPDPAGAARADAATTRSSGVLVDAR